MEQWSNNACLGYVIEGAKALGYTDKHIEELVKAVAVSSIGPRLEKLPKFITNHLTRRMSDEPS
jgi:alkylhydroperoxidase/carboxymuconolactone decarboxylase family protein YurZ